MEITKNFLEKAMNTLLISLATLIAVFGVMLSVIALTRINQLDKNTQAFLTAQVEFNDSITTNLEGLSAFIKK